MQRMSSFRQQTHYELLGLSFLVGGFVRKFAVSASSFGALSVFCKVTCKGCHNLITFVQASQEDIRVAYKRLALVRLRLFVQAKLGPLHLRQTNLCCVCRCGILTEILTAIGDVLRTGFRPSSKPTQACVYAVYSLGSAA